MNNLTFRLRIFLIILIAIIAIGTFGFVAAEGLSFADAFYFSIVTVATVGYGDISPVTTVGKVLSVFLIVTGVGTFLGVVANATEILMSRQELKARREKLNIIISAFFSEAGTELLRYFVEHDSLISEINKDLIVTNEWTPQQFSYARQKIKEREFVMDIHKEDLDLLRNMLVEKGSIFLRILENPTILEHETFTDLLRAFIHMKEELLYREGLSEIPQSDLNHVAGDIKRVYSLLVYQWLDYMKYLKDNYPYLFSLAIRMNPFHEVRSPIVK